MYVVILAFLNWLMSLPAQALDLILYRWAGIKILPHLVLYFTFFLLYTTCTLSMLAYNVPHIMYAYSDINFGYTVLNSGLVLMSWNFVGEVRNKQYIGLNRRI